MKQLLPPTAHLILFGGLLFFSVITFANPAITFCAKSPSSCWLSFAVVTVTPPSVTPAAPVQSPSNVVSISGKVTQECGEAVENVKVSLGNNTVFTGADGTYTFNGIPVGADVSICAEYMPDPLNPFSNEVTICDLITLSKHILGIEAITDIRRLLCSDVNQNGALSTFDLVEIRKNYLLSKMDPFGNIPPQYLFLPDGTIFPGLGGPSGCLNIENIQGSVTNADFVRIAVADVDGSGANCMPVVPSPFQFITTNKTFIAGETFTIDIAPEIPVQGFQFTLETMGLTIDTIVAAVPYFPPSVAISGNLARLIWIGEIGSLQKPTLQVTLTANVDGNLSDHLTILTGTNQLAPVVTTGQCMSVLPGMEFKTVGTGEIAPNKLRLFPNPWREKTNLEINALASSSASIILTDASGKVLFTKKVQLSKGYNVLTLNREDIAVSGVIFYRVVTPGTTWSGTIMKF